MIKSIGLALAGLVTSFAISANACPVFEGSYHCKTANSDKVVTLSTSKVAGGTQYTLDGSPFLADGTYRKVHYQGGDYDMAGVCKDQSLSLKVKFAGGAAGENPACKNESWETLYILTWTPNGNDINEHTSGAVLCKSGRARRTGTAPLRPRPRSGRRERE